MIKYVFQWFYLLTTFFFFSCSSKWVVPPDYLGEWQTGKQKITVRTHQRHSGYQFTSDSAIVIIKIFDNKTVSGSVGDALFENAVLIKNSGNPKITGVSFVVRCGKIGKIFPNDPLDSKEVEIWLSPVKNSMNAELRYTEGLAVFPMAGLEFVKK
jgi:hypothetical protein